MTGTLIRDWNKNPPASCGWIFVVTDLGLELSPSRRPGTKQ